MCNYATMTGEQIWEIKPLTLCMDGTDEHSGRLTQLVFTLTSLDLNGDERELRESVE